MDVPKLPAVRYTHSRPAGFGEWVTLRSFVTNDPEFAQRVLHRDIAVHGADTCQTRENVLSSWGPER